jgi:hypothetical protein
MKKKTQPVKPAVPPPAAFQGYPLTDFLENSNLGDLRQMLQKGTIPHYGGYVTKGPHVLVHDLKTALEGVYLARFESSVLPGKTSMYIYEVGFNSARTVGVILRNPFDTILAFGAPKPKPPVGGGGGLPDPRLPERKPGAPGVGAAGAIGTKGTGAGARYAMKARKGKTTGGKFVRAPGVKGAEIRPPTTPMPWPKPVACDLNLRFVVDGKNTLQSLHIFGTSVRFFFSTGLVQPVRKSGGKYLPKDIRQKVALGNATVMLMRGRRPRLSKELTFEDNLVQIGGQNLIAKLNKVTLGGTFAKPKLVFKDTEILF